MNKKNISEFIQKHYKKLLPLLFLAPVSAKAQNNTQPLNPSDVKVVNFGDNEKISSENNTIEFTNVSAEDSTTVHPKYSGSDEPYVARTPKDLPEMSAEQAVLYQHRREFVGYFNSNGKFEVLRTDARYCAAAPKVITGVFRAECQHYNKSHLELRHAKDKMSRAFADETECLKYLKDENNSLGEVIEDYCNFRKKYTKGKGGRKSVVVRAGFFQGGINEWTACLRAAFCSPDENMQKFASIFIENTPENLAVRDSVINNVYNKDGEFINGDEGVQKRLKIRPLLSKLQVSGIKGDVGFSQKFCDSLRYYTQKQKFDDEQKEFKHSQMVDAVKKLQEDYVIAWYLLTGNNSSSATSIDNDIAREFNKKTGKKISAKEVKKHGLGIHLSPGKILIYIESNINGGPYHKGIYPLTKTILAKFAQTFDTNKMLSQEFLRQAAIVGISGAKETYEEFLQKVSALQNEEQEIVKKLERKIIRNPAPNDAIKVPVYVRQEHKPIKLKLPQKFQQRTKQK